MRQLAWVLAIAAIGYVGLVALLYVAQRGMLYVPPLRERIPPEAVGFPQAEEVILNTSDGERIVAWYVPPQPGRFLVIFFHGNGDSIVHRVERFREIVSDGTGLLALSFRGYSGSSGSPTEDGLLRDAEAAHAFAAARYPAERIAFWGYSLGSGPAVMIAAERPIGKLVLEAPYTSAADVAASIYPFVPVRWLMKDQFRSDEYIGKFSVPLLVMHGARDRVVAERFGRRLFALAREPKKFVSFPQGGHADLDNHGAIAAVREFLYEAGP